MKGEKPKGFLLKCFSNFHEHSNSPQDLVLCKFWLSRSGERPTVLASDQLWVMPMLLVECRGCEAYFSGIPRQQLCLPVTAADSCLADTLCSWFSIMLQMLDLVSTSDSKEHGLREISNFDQWSCSSLKPYPSKAKPEPGVLLFSHPHLHSRFPENPFSSVSLPPAPSSINPHLTLMDVFQNEIKLTPGKCHSAAPHSSKDFYLFCREKSHPPMLPRWFNSKESACQCRRRRRCRCDPWVRKIPWRTAWQPTPIFLPGKSHGQRSLAGFSPWGRKESDMIECAYCVYYDI